MGIAVLAPIMYPMGYAISSNLIIGHIVKDYLDQTIPDGAYYLGYIMAKEFLYEEGWEAGKLETFQGKEYGRCDHCDNKDSRIVSDWLEHHKIAQIRDFTSIVDLGYLKIKTVR